MTIRRLSLIALAGVAALATGCASGPTASGPRAVVVLAPTTGSSTSGSVNFIKMGPRVLVQGEVRGLRPNAQHGFHVHEKGDCTSGDGMSAGGHFNPTGQPHGRHAAGMHHTGDLPSLQADAAGVARFSFESTSISVDGGDSDIAGRGLIVHRDVDDFSTQPTGNAGPRLACGVIVRRP